MTSVAHTLGRPLATGDDVQESVLLLSAVVILANIYNLVILYQRPTVNQLRDNWAILAYALVLSCSTVLAWGQPRAILLPDKLAGWQSVFLLLNCGQLPVAPHDERQVKAQWVHLNCRVQNFVPVPLTGSVVVLVEEVSGTENMAEIPAVLVRVQVVLFDELLNSLRPHKVVRVAKVDLLDGNPVSGDGVGIIWNPLGNPVVPGDDFHVPNIVFVTEDDPISLSRTVLFDQTAQVANPFFSTVDEGKGGGNDEVFVNSGFGVQGVKRKDPLVGINTFSCAHADILGVKAAFVKNPLVLVIDVRRPLVAVAISWTVDDTVVEVSLDLVRVVAVGRVDNQPHWVQWAKGVVITGSHRRPVDAGIFTNKNGSTSR